MIEQSINFLMESMVDILKQYGYDEKEAENIVIPIFGFLGFIILIFTLGFSCWLFAQFGFWWLDKFIF